MQKTKQYLRKKKDLGELVNGDPNYFCCFAIIKKGFWGAPNW